MTELITHGVKNPKRFWKSVSKQKTLKMCDLKFKLKYIDFLESEPQSEVAVVGSLIHEAWSDTLKEGIDDLWFDMDIIELKELFYNKYRNRIVNHKNFSSWIILYENNVRHLAEFESARFMSFFVTIKNGIISTKVYQEEDNLVREEKTEEEILHETKTLIKDYFLPVSTEKFMKNGLFLYNFIADAIFRIYNSGVPERDNTFMIFDLKAGSAQPSDVRSDDKGQVTSYSIFWNSIIDYPLETENALRRLKDEYYEMVDEYNDISDIVPEAEEFYEKELKSTKKNYDLTKESNELISSLKGRITHWGILYLGNKTLHYDEIKKVSKTYAHKRFNKMAEKIESNIETGIWENVWGKQTCWFMYFDKISNQEKDFKCDFYQHCWEKNNPDLAWED